MHRATALRSRTPVGLQRLAVDERHDHEPTGPVVLEDGRRQPLLCRQTLGIDFGIRVDAEFIGYERCRPLATDDASAFILQHDHSIDGHH